MPIRRAKGLCFGLLSLLFLVIAPNVSHAEDDPITCGRYGRAVQVATTSDQLQKLVNRDLAGQCPVAAAEARKKLSMIAPAPTVPMSVQTTERRAATPAAPPRDVEAETFRSATTCELMRAFSDRYPGGRFRLKAAAFRRTHQCDAPQRAETEIRASPATLTPGYISGGNFRDCPTCPQMVVIPTGSVLMGSPANEFGRDSDEGPQHRVTIGRAFAVGKYDVTFDEWSACVSGGGCTSNPNPSDAGFGRGDRPVINVNWEDAQGYVSWLSKVTGQSYRLLTEAEWEYAARAGTDTAYSFGNDASQLGAYGWYTTNSNARTHPVGQKLPNGFGLYDMHGNVWQWVQDCYSDSYSGASMDGSANTTKRCGNRVLRGGSWYSIPRFLRSAIRNLNAPSGRGNYFGFRVARTLSPP